MFLRLKIDLESSFFTPLFLEYEIVFARVTNLFSDMSAFEFLNCFDTWLLQTILSLNLNSIYLPIHLSSIYGNNHK